MDWLEQLTAERRKNDPDYAEVEKRLEEEDGGFILSAFDDSGREFDFCEGNSKGMWPINPAPQDPSAGSS